MKKTLRFSIVASSLSALILFVAAAPESRVDLLREAKTEGEPPVRFLFQVDTPGKFAAVQYSGPAGARLNGQAIPVPLDGMNYRTIPAIPPSLLKKGSNVLSVPKGRPRLVGLLPEALAFQSGPVLGAAGKNYFTVACRTNMPAEVKLTVTMMGRRKGFVLPTIISKPGVHHALRVERLRPRVSYTYTLEAVLPGKKTGVKTKQYSVRTPAASGGELTFVAAGDSRNNPRAWGKVASAIARAKPAFVALTGDMVGGGRNDWEWDEMFFGPAKDPLATIPTFAAIGNHEQNSPLFLRMLPTPNGKKNWSQQIGPVLLIGIDGSMDWNTGSKLAKWLEETLAGSKAKFIFLLNHYPAWTSSRHGGLNGQGRPNERPIRLGQDVIMPLLRKYGVAAMISGHDHIYERSEPPDGVTVIITGGAGAPLYEKSSRADKQNPHSKVLARAHHFCLFSVKGNTCSMKAVTVDGKVIDTRTWKARKVK